MVDFVFEEGVFLAFGQAFAFFFFGELDLAAEALLEVTSIVICDFIGWQLWELFVKHLREAMKSG
jgi:hypothetical protein|tara:strand:+ start:1068 stop:1262 length:195 start_codon:yes stop_codon:yes gene_type:complete